MSTHPDLEALNAVLDGESEGAGDAGHMAGCAACQARLAQLRSVQAAVGAPVAPPGAGVREAAITRALESVAAASAEAGAAAGEAPPAPTPPTELRRRDGSRVWESPVWRWAAGSAAAAVVAIAIVTAALGGGGRSDDETGVALSAGPGADNKATQESAAPPPDGVVNGGDLGEVRDTATLRSLVPVQRGQSAVAPVGGAATRNAADSAAPAAPAPRAVGTRVCEIEARTARPQLPVLVYAANLRYQGTAAVVLGFGDFPGAAPVTLLVLAPGESCRVIAESTAP